MAFRHKAVRRRMPEPKVKADWTTYVALAFMFGLVLVCINFGGF